MASKISRTQAKNSNVTTWGPTHDNAGTLLVVVIHGMRYQSGDVPFLISSVTFNSDSLAELGYIQSTTLNRNYLTSVWYRYLPDVGNYTVSITSTQQIHRTVVQVLSFTDVDPTTPIVLGDLVNVDGPWADTITTNDLSEIWFAVTCRANTSSIDPGSGNTEEVEDLQTTGDAITDVRAALIYKQFATAGSNTLTGITGPPASTRGTNGIFFAINGIGSVVLDVDNVDASSEVTPVTLGQTQVLGVGALTSQSQVTSVSIAQVQILDISDVLADPAEVVQINIATRVELSLSDIDSGIPTIGMISVIQVVELSLGNLVSSAAIVDDLELAQVNVLALESLTSQPVVGYIGLTQIQALGVPYIESMPVISSVSLGQVNSLSLGDITGSSEVSAVSLTQQQVLSLGNIDGSSLVGDVTLFQRHSLQLANVVSGVPSIGLIIVTALGLTITPRQRVILPKVADRVVLAPVLSRVIQPRDKSRTVFP